MTAAPHPTPAEIRFAEAMVNSDAGLRTYASCEWDDLGDDGKAWIAIIIREALKTASYADAMAAIDVRLKEMVDDPPEGFWRSCTGCHETFEGHSVGTYSWHAAMKCELGADCRECGGIGAVWDDTDYDDMVEFMMHAEREEDAGKRVQRAVLDIIGDPHPNELSGDVSDNTFASIHTTAGHLRRLRLALTKLTG